MVRKKLTEAKDRCSVLMKGSDVKGINDFIAENDPPEDGADATAAPAGGKLPAHRPQTQC